MIKSKKTRVDDISISYYIKESTGDSKNTIIFIHGFPFNKKTWKAQLEVLPDNVTGIAIDVRGHGLTTAGHGFFSIDVFAKDLKKFMDKLAIEKATICGVSMGGYIALRFVELFPTLTNALILSDTHHKADDNIGKKKRFDSIEAILKHGRRPFSIGFVENLFTPHTLKENERIVEKIKSAIRRNSITNICSTQLALASRTDTTHILQEINIPTLIFRGEKDKITPLEPMQEMHNLIQSSEFIHIPEAGHLPNLEQPEIFNKHVLNFINKI